MQKIYSSKGFTYSDKHTKAVFCPKENIVKVLQYQKERKTRIEENIQRLENDLIEIGKSNT